MLARNNLGAHVLKNALPNLNNFGRCTAPENIDNRARQSWSVVLRNNCTRPKSPDVFSHGCSFRHNSMRPDYQRLDQLIPKHFFPRRRDQGSGICQFAGDVQTRQGTVKNYVIA